MDYLALRPRFRGYFGLADDLPTIVLQRLVSLLLAKRSTRVREREVTTRCHVHSCFEIQICSVQDRFSGREIVRRGPDGPILPRSQSSEVASGPYDLVLRDICIAALSRQLQAFS